MSEQKLRIGADLSSLPDVATDHLDPLMSKFGWHFECGAVEENFQAYRQYSSGNLHLRVHLGTHPIDTMTAYVYMWEGSKEMSHYPDSECPLDIVWYVDEGKRIDVERELWLTGRTVREVLLSITTLFQAELQDFLSGDVARLKERNDARLVRLEQWQRSRRVNGGKSPWWQRTTGWKDRLLLLLVAVSVMFILGLIVNGLLG